MTEFLPRPTLSILDASHQNSLWVTRCWTLQEAHCSISLCFADHGVYLFIHDGVMSGRLSIQLIDGGGTYFSFLDSVEGYYKIRPSKPNGILPAFAGVMNLRYQDNGCFGAPTWGNDNSLSVGFSGWIQWNPAYWTLPPRFLEGKHVFPC